MIRAKLLFEIKKKHVICKTNIYSVGPYTRMLVQYIASHRIKKRNRKT